MCPEWALKLGTADRTSSHHEGVHSLKEMTNTSPQCVSQRGESHQVAPPTAPQTPAGSLEHDVEGAVRELEDYAFGRMTKLGGADRVAVGVQDARDVQRGVAYGDGQVGL